LGQKLTEGDRESEGAWNFGPERTGNQTVAKVLEKLQLHWPEMQWHKTATTQPHEAQLLYLDSTKAYGQLGWQPVWDLDTTLQKTAEWYRAFLDTQTLTSVHQLFEYLEAAKQAQVGWLSS
jgi:CDP-glucose 4,6-dehydratase